MISRTQGWIPTASRRASMVAVIGFLVAMVDGHDTLMLAWRRFRPFQPRLQ
jgi:hypothetical protein